ELVFLPALPLSRSGKVDRQALPAPRSERPELPAHETPRTSEQQTVADAFASVLGVRAVGLHDNFFALGGHSLLAVQVVSQVHEQVGIDIPLSVLFAEPTVEALARWMEGAQTSSPEALDS